MIELMLKDSVLSKAFQMLYFLVITESTSDVYANARCSEGKCSYARSKVSYRLEVENIL